MSVVDQFFNIEVLMRIWPALMRGIGLTLTLSLIALPLSMLVALALACLQDRCGPVMRAILVGYIDVMRALPPLVLLIFVFYGLPFLGLNFNSVTAAILALVLNSSSYTAEIFRAGIKSVPKGQREAAASSGLSWWQSMRRVVLPQAIRNVTPDLASNAIELVKLTSIVSAVAMQDLLRSAMMAQNLTYNATPLIAAALIYFLMLWPFVRIVSRLQAKSTLGIAR